MSRYVFDSFALLARLRNEPGGARVTQLLNSAADERWMTMVNLGEVYYRVVRETGSAGSADNAIRWAESQPIAFVDADRALTMAAARLKAQYPMSYADCFAAALAQQLDAAVVTGDPEFRRLEREDIVSVEWLLPPTR